MILSIYTLPEPGTLPEWRRGSPRGCDTMDQSQHDHFTSNTPQGLAQSCDEGDDLIE